MYKRGLDVRLHHSCQSRNGYWRCSGPCSQHSSWLRAAHCLRPHQRRDIRQECVEVDPQRAPQPRVFELHGVGPCRSLLSRELRPIQQPEQTSSVTILCLILFTFLLLSVYYCSRPGHLHCGVHTIHFNLGQRSLYACHPLQLHSTTCLADGLSLHSNLNALIDNPYLGLPA